MKYLLLFPFLLIGLQTTISAQDKCPESQLITIAETQDTVRVVLLGPDSDECPADSTIFTIDGATSAWGLLTTNEALLNVGVNEVTYFNCAKIEDKTLDEPQLLPDGNGTEYQIPFTLSGYPEGSTVGEVGQLVVICATMEHSYLGDLDIWVGCPDGTPWMLHQFNRNNQVARQLLGRGDQNTNSPDPAYQYCWRIGAEFTFEEYIVRNSLGSDQSLPAGTYAPEDPLSVIADCVVNGEWGLYFRDNLTNDNGSVAAWSVAFESPDVEKCSYEIEVKQRPVGISPVEHLPGLRLTVTPNPFDEELVLNAQAAATATAHLAVYTISGQEMLSERVALAPGGQQLSYTTENWPVGIYFLRIQTEEGEIIRKIIRR